MNFSFLKSYPSIYTEYQGEIFAHRLTMVAPWLRPAAARSLADDSLTVCAPSAAFPPVCPPLPPIQNKLGLSLHSLTRSPPTHTPPAPTSGVCTVEGSVPIKNSKLFLLFHLNVKIAEYSMSNIDYVSEHKSH